MAESETPPHCLIPTTLRLLSGREISPCIVLLALRPPMTNNRATKKELSTLIIIICTDRRPRQDTCRLQNKPVYAKKPTSLADYHLETITCWELQGWPAAAVRGHKHMTDVNCVCMWSHHWTIREMQTVCTPRQVWVLRWFRMSVHKSVDLR